LKENSVFEIWGYVEWGQALLNAQSEGIPIIGNVRKYLAVLTT